jgi:hypothetical protein
MSKQPEALRLAHWLEDTESTRLHLLPYAADELRRLSAVNQELLGALRWIERRCPAQLLQQELHRIHMEAAHDAGACARAAIAKATEEPK